VGCEDELVTEHSADAPDIFERFAPPLMPPWDELPESVRQAWIELAASVGDGAER
jgi:hypothetical protein